MLGGYVGLGGFYARPTMNAQRKLEAILEELRSLLPQLRERYAVDTLEAFGSRVRGDGEEGRDLDLLVTFTETPDLLTFIAMENELADRLGVPVDLVMRRSLKPHIFDKYL